MVGDGGYMNGEDKAEDKCAQTTRQCTYIDASRLPPLRYLKTGSSSAWFFEY
jgi:hypothetical protein